MQDVPVVYISSLVLTFLKHFVCLGFFINFCFFFKENSGFFLHNRVATLFSGIERGDELSKLTN